DDEITSAAARIRAAGAERVALVLPYGSRLATSRINFRLLAREATERGKRIEVICADASARALALAAGLAVHPSVASFEARQAGGGPVAGAGAADALQTPAATGAAPGAPGTAPAPKLAEDSPDDTSTRVLAVPRRGTRKVPVVGPPRPPMRTGIAMGLGLAAIVAVVAGVLIGVELLPSAAITLHPRSAPIGPLNLTVEARPDLTAPDPANLAIPAQRFTFVLEASDTFPATGVKVTNTRATGTVTFSNFDTGSSIRVVEGAVVETESGIAFRTLAVITLPNARIQFPFTIVPSTASVDVEAVEAGPEGNVGNNTITVVPKGANKRLLQVSNDQATSGGAHEEHPVVSEDDVTAATEALDAALVVELDRQVSERTGIPANMTLFPQTRAVGESEYSVDLGTLVDAESEEFSLGATAEGSALGVDAAPLTAVAEARLRTRVTEGWTLDATSIQTEVGTPTVLGEIVSYPITIAGTQVHGVTEAALLPVVKGLLIPEARNLLDDYGDVEIAVWPDWVTRIPTRDDRVTLTIGDPQTAPSESP
ncbi:MAG TPA: baseplate J/gp47 family protein, partial [Candidatus Limnocylindria bacterium]|nr:baseplate J/gp47 family protein [Candidatus Limnocylindria bacterium]